MKAGSFLSALVDQRARSPWSFCTARKVGLALTGTKIPGMAQQISTLKRVLKDGGRRKGCWMKHLYERRLPLNVLLCRISYHLHNVDIQSESRGEICEFFLVFGMLSCPVIDWQPAQSVTHLAPKVNWDRTIGWTDDWLIGWMDGFLVLDQEWLFENIFGRLLINSYHITITITRAIL